LAIKNGWKKADKTEIHSHNESMSEHGGHEHPSHQNFDNAANTYRKLKSGEPVIAHSDDHHERSIKSVRTAMYKGQRIVIRTLYEIEIDGSPMKQSISVPNDGNVHTHILPNYSFHSTIDLIETLIDRYPESFLRRE
jgi:hypothetical protein